MVPFWRVAPNGAPKGTVLRTIKRCRHHIGATYFFEWMLNGHPSLHTFKLFWRIKRPRLKIPEFLYFWLIDWFLFILCVCLKIKSSLCFFIPLVNYYKRFPLDETASAQLVITIQLYENFEVKICKIWMINCKHREKHCKQYAIYFWCIQIFKHTMLPQASSLV